MTAIDSAARAVARQEAEVMHRIGLYSNRHKHLINDEKTGYRLSEIAGTAYEGL